MKKLVKSLGFTSLVVTGALGIGLVAANADATHDKERETTISDFAQTIDGDIELAQGEVLDVSKPFSHKTHLSKKVAEHRAKSPRANRRAASIVLTATRSPRPTDSVPSRKFASLSTTRARPATRPTSTRHR